MLLGTVENHDDDGAQGRVLVSFPDFAESLQQVQGHLGSSVGPAWSGAIRETNPSVEPARPFWVNAFLDAD